MLDASGFYFLGREGSCCLKELQKPRGPRGSAQKIDLTGETLVCATAPGELSDRGGKADWQSAHVKMLGSELVVVTAELRKSIWPNLRMIG